MMELKGCLHKGHSALIFDHSRRHLKQNSCRQLLVKHLLSCLPRQIEHTGSGEDRPDGGGETDLAGEGKVSELLSCCEEPFFFLFPGREELLALDDILIKGFVLRLHNSQEP